MKVGIIDAIVSHESDERSSLRLRDQVKVVRSIRGWWLQHLRTVSIDG